MKNYQVRIILIKKDSHKKLPSIMVASKDIESAKKLAKETLARKGYKVRSASIAPKDTIVVYLED